MVYSTTSGTGRRRVMALQAKVTLQPQSSARFRRALRTYAAATGKAMPEVLNRAHRNLMQQTIRRTPRASMSDIERFSPYKGGKARRARKSDVAPIRVATPTESKPRAKSNDPSRLFFAKANKSGYRKGGGVRSMAERIYKSRRRSVGFVAAGFVKPLIVFGGMSKSKVTSQSAAGESTGELATPRRLISVAKNRVPAADKVAAGPAQAALVHVAEDMYRYALGKMEAQARKAIRLL